MFNSNKKGQFYIIAAVIIAMIIVGMAGVSNYVITEEEPTEFYDLGGNLELEGAWVIDYGIYQQQDIEGNLDAFVEQYIEYFSEGEENLELVIVYGNNLEVQTANCTTSSPGDVGVLGAEVSGNTEIKCGIFTDLDTISRDSVEVTLLDTEYPIDLTENKNFYFVIGRERGEETDVYTNV